MHELPARGAQVRELDLTLPPDRMPRMAGTRPLKRWRYVGVYTPDVMLCVGEARIGMVPQRWWAVALPDGSLHERTTLGRGGVSLEGARVEVESAEVRIALDLSEGPGVEIASPAGDSYIWTRKQACVPVRGRIELGGRTLAIEGDWGFVDESAGYHERRTTWKWSAGVGRAEDGTAVGWNLVTGIHDSPNESERTLWLEGEPRELPPLDFAPDLSAVGGLRFREWATREDHTNVGLFRSDYRQPFGTFEGEIGGVALAEGYGVMETHDVLW